MYRKYECWSIFGSFARGIREAEQAAHQKLIVANDEEQKEKAKKREKSEEASAGNPDVEARSFGTDGQTSSMTHAHTADEEKKEEKWSST